MEAPCNAKPRLVCQAGASAIWKVCAGREDLPCFQPLTWGIVSSRATHGRVGILAAVGKLTE